MMIFNENLIRLRKSKGLSQEELGNELNVAIRNSSASTKHLLLGDVHPYKVCG